MNLVIKTLRYQKGIVPVLKECEEEEEEEEEEDCRLNLLEEEEEVDVRFHVYICNVSSYCPFSKIAYDIKTLRYQKEILPVLKECIFSMYIF